MEQEAPRQLPYDVDIEQALLGAILVDNYLLERISTSLKPEHFYDPLHQRLYEAVERMWAKGHAVTPLTLKSLMEQDAGLQEVGGQAYLVSLARAAPALPNVRDYARILADLAMRRELIRIGEDIVNTAFEAPLDVAPAEQIDEAEKALYRISEKGRFGEGPQGFDRALADAVSQAEQALARGGTRRVDVICPGFAADCLETLEEIAVQNAELFEAAGGSALHYIPALNTRPDHLAMMVELIERHTQGWEAPSADERATAAERARALGAPA